MRVIWAIPAWGQTLASTSGDMVRAQHLIEALRNAGHDVYVVERSGASSVSSASDIMAAGYRGVVRRLLPRQIALALRDVSRYGNSRAFGRRVAEEARRRQADLIIETQKNCATSGAVAARLTGLPLVLDDCSPSLEEVELGSGLPGLARRILISQADAASVVVATSSSVRDRLVAEGVPEGKIRLIRNGVNLAAFEMSDRDAVRARLGLSDSCVFGFVGSFLDWHRVDLLIEAVSLISREQKVRVLLLGNGPHLQPALERAQRLCIAPLVTSLGPVPPQEVPKFMAALDVGVLPDTLDYGNPMKLTEYAAAGIPAVAPDRPSVREVVRDGETGLLFAPQDMNALAQALSRLAKDAELRREMGTRARREVAAPAAWSALAERLIEGLGNRAGA